jgi:predicted ATPase
VPEVKEVTGPLEVRAVVDAETARIRLFEAVTALLTSVARARGLVVVLDDLQWADPASLQLLEFLSARLATTPLRVLGSYRPAEVGARHPLTNALAALARHHVGEHVRLGGLDGPEVASLVSAITGMTASSDVLETVLARTEGNPFFVVELARLLSAEHHLRAEAVESAVPTAVRDVLRRRLGRLPDSTVSLLSLAALLGRDFELAVVELAAGLEGERSLELVELR